MPDSPGLWQQRGFISRALVIPGEDNQAVLYFCPVLLPTVNHEIIAAPGLSSELHQGKCSLLLLLEKPRARGWCPKC